ncbi:helix-turn-helix transcriptional regulator [Caproicibacter fermentans]|uniref:helix-turn-helix transcriptional regulator n=1 Tax=Caproicibacter fermentans TaxID=2576756 RepID=UPI00141324C2|nr:helix-turn-helix transcriptional regulator [Caproicibacter fermentans]
MKEPAKSEYHLLGRVDSVVLGSIYPDAPRQKSFLLLFIRSGAGELSREGRNWNAVPGSFFLLRFGISYLLQSKSDPLRITGFLISGTPNRLPFFCHTRADSDVRKLLDTLAGSQPCSDANSPVLDRLIALLQADYAYGKRPVLFYLDQLKNILDDRYAERLSLSQFAEEIHVNKFRLAKEFKANFGLSPIEYLINRRVQEACRMLLQTNVSVADIGNAVGMENTPYFIRTFKRKVGCTPGNFRSAPRQFTERFSTVRNGLLNKN